MPGNQSGIHYITNVDFILVNGVPVFIVYFFRAKYGNKKQLCFVVLLLVLVVLVVVAVVLVGVLVVAAVVVLLLVFVLLEVAAAVLVAVLVVVPPLNQYLVRPRGRFGVFINVNPCATVGLGSLCGVGTSCWSPGTKSRTFRACMFFGDLRSSGEPLKVPVI